MICCILKKYSRAAGDRSHVKNVDDMVERRVQSIPELGQLTWAQNMICAGLRRISLQSQGMCGIAEHAVSFSPICL
jgi:hypothetical protein